MTKDEAINYFGTQQALGAAIRVTQGTISGWKEIPWWRQFQIEAATGGALVADPKHDKFRVQPKAPSDEAAA